MIDRQHGKLIIGCDSCDETFEGGSSNFSKVWAEAEHEGWTQRKIADEWLHGCDETFDTDTGDFAATSRREGWTSRKIATEWFHGCPKCRLANMTNTFKAYALWHPEYGYDFDEFPLWGKTEYEAELILHEIGLWPAPSGWRIVEVEIRRIEK